MMFETPPPILKGPAQPSTDDGLQDLAEILLTIQAAPMAPRSPEQNRSAGQETQDLNELERSISDSMISSFKRTTDRIEGNISNSKKRSNEEAFSSLKEHPGFEEKFSPEEGEEDEGDDEEDEDEMAEEDEDSEDLYIGSNDSDEEWMEPLHERTGNERRREIGDRTDRKEGSSRPKRKKAPSGSACEKHKRWKKRCPDDCPMRKARFRNMGKKIEKPRDDKRTTRGKAKLIKREKVEPKEEPIDSINESKQDDIDIEEGGKELNLLIHHEMEEDLAAEEGKDKPSGLTQRDTDPKTCRSCQRKDLSLNLRCHCQKKVAKSPIIEKETFAKKENTENEKSKRTTHKRTAAQIEGRNKRLKYLPRSCERHKLLHAKCTADCPDRIQRDEVEKKPEISEKIHWKKKLAHSPPLPPTSPSTTGGNVSSPTAGVLTQSC